MDLSAPEEALKAQVVALYSFYSYQRAQNTGNEADFACDTANWLVYVPQSAMEERWGEDFASLYERLENVVGSVQGQVLTWEGEPICAAFFAISGGNTESSQQVWGQEPPYLQSVASPGDAFVRGTSTVSLTAEELRQATANAWGEELDFSGPVEDWVTAVSTSPSGYVESAQVGGKTVTGEELREALGLRSACFQLRVVDEVFQFTVHGWGHGVGMSQAGGLSGQPGRRAIRDLGPLLSGDRFGQGMRKGQRPAAPFFLIFDSSARPSEGRGWKCPPGRKLLSQPLASYNRPASNPLLCTRPCTPR